MFRIVSFLAASFLVVLFYKIATSNPLFNKEYEEVVQFIMEKEGYLTTQEVAHAFPQVEKIKTDLGQLSYLKRNLNSLTGGPAPQFSKERNLQIEAYQKEIQLLNQSIKEDLYQLRSLYVEVTASRGYFR